MGNICKYCCREELSPRDYPTEIVCRSNPIVPDTDSQLYKFNNNLKEKLGIDISIVKI